MWSWYLHLPYGLLPGGCRELDCGSDWSFWPPLAFVNDGNSDKSSSGGVELNSRKKIYMSFLVPVVQMGLKFKLGYIGVKNFLALEIDHRLTKT